MEQFHIQPAGKAAVTIPCLDIGRTCFQDALNHGVQFQRRKPARLQIEQIILAANISLVVTLMAEVALVDLVCYASRAFQISYDIDFHGCSVFFCLDSFFQGYPA